MPTSKIYVSKYFRFILLVAICTAGVVILEVISDTHFQTFTSYAEYNYYFFNTEVTGSYGLSYTFESEGGFKRFASFFANPLEHAAATVLALSVIAALYTNDNYKLKLDLFGKFALVATFISIVFAISRAAFVSYFIVIYVYSLLAKKTYIIHAVNVCILLGAMYLFYILRNSDLIDVVVNTINFSNPSSAGHVIEWIQGITAMIKSPLGLGLGTSGRVAGAAGENVGGENQFIIIGVQVGVIAVSAYLTVYFLLVKTAVKWYRHLEGKEKKICLALLLMKIGFFIPSFTSELESSPYILYMTWFFSGSFITVVMNRRRRDNVKSLKEL
jgi:lipid-A-disaccharide synthase-like uncharacterized protein